jgi:hypothetical protein
LIFIVLSSIALAVDNPLLDPKSTTVTILKNLEYIMTAIFFLEVVIKVIASGFVLNGS